jgi:hypothetical protein
MLFSFWVVKVDMTRGRWSLVASRQVLLDWILGYCRVEDL